jgi:3-demethylubiquinone-9 3-methyltransferase
LPLVRQSGRRGSKLLRVHLQELESHRHLAIQRGRAGGASPARWLSDDREFRARWSDVYRAQRRTGIQVQRSGVTSDEVDYYWDKLSKGGDPKAQECGWLKDRYGLSWQVVPRVLIDMLKDHSSEKAKRAMEAMLRMKKINIAELEHAYAAG